MTGSLILKSFCNSAIRVIFKIIIIMITATLKDGQQTATSRSRCGCRASSPSSCRSSQSSPSSKLSSLSSSWQCRNQLHDHDIDHHAEHGEVDKGRGRKNSINLSIDICHLLLITIKTSLNNWKKNPKMLQIKWKSHYIEDIRRLVWFRAHDASLEWVNIDTAGWSQRSAVCSQQKCLCCLIVNIVISRQSVMFSKSAVLLLLCLQAFGLMPGIGGLVMGEEGLAANCTTRLMSAKMGQRHRLPFLNLFLNFDFTAWQVWPSLCFS